MCKVYHVTIEHIFDGRVEIEERLSSKYLWLLRLQIFFSKSFTIQTHVNGRIVKSDLEKVIGEIKGNPC